MFNLGSKWATLKIPLSLFPFWGICVYYVMVYKQKNSTWISASCPGGCGQAASFLPTEISDSHDSHENPFWVQVTSDVTQRDRREECLPLVSPVHYGPPSSGPGKCHGPKTFIHPFYYSYHQLCHYPAIFCPFPRYPKDTRILSDHAIST